MLHVILLHWSWIHVLKLILKLLIPNRHWSFTVLSLKHKPLIHLVRRLEPMWARVRLVKRPVPILMKVLVLSLVILSWNLNLFRGHHKLLVLGL